MGSDNSKQSAKGTERQEQIKTYQQNLENAHQIRVSIDDKDETTIDSTQGRDLSSMDPSALKEWYCSSHPVVDPIDEKALQIDPRDWDFPFENMVMEGGGNKGLAYCGAVKCFEELGLMKKIKRIGGASAGAITSALVAFGYNSDEIRAFLSDDIESIFLDHSCGYFSLVPNLLRNYGWNPGHKIYKWFGDAIEKKTGNPDTTFNDLYTSRDIELCIVVTNLNLMSAQYCHTKTTPDMPIRDALRMTMAIPGVFSAIHYDNHGQTDIFVDGGVICNYPINCFDGWYLSMKSEDQFMQKLKPLKDLTTLMSPENRFKATGPNKTIGFLLFNESEREIMKFNLEKRVGSLLPEKPAVETDLYKEMEAKRKTRNKAEKEHICVVEAVDSFLAVLNKHNKEEKEHISRRELSDALQDPAFSEEHKALLFGNDFVTKRAFDILDKDGNGEITVMELIRFIEERGIRVQMRFQGYGRRDVKSFGAFVGALQNTLLTNLKYVTVNETDEDRTVGINTGHIGTMDYTIEETDRDFVVQRGYNATLSFLRYYVVNHASEMKRKKPEVTVTQPGSDRNGNTKH